MPCTGKYCYAHFTNEETEAQGGEITCLVLTASNRSGIKILVSASKAHLLKQYAVLSA